MHPPLHKPTNETGSSLPFPSHSVSLLKLEKEGTEAQADLSVSSSFLLLSACGEVIKNLEICHTKFKQFFGGCNQMKYDLNYCLRAEVSFSEQRGGRERGRGGKEKGGRWLVGWAWVGGRSRGFRR